MADWNYIIKRNRQYIKSKDKVKSQVEKNKLEQIGLTENLQTLFKPILKSQEDIKKKLEATPKQQIQELPQIEYPIEVGEIIIRTLDDIKHYFSNPDPTLPKTIKPTTDQDGLILNVRL
ncbi:hypothetical protein LOTGIDRAFT_155886 [Lottia gigantea]|uniref:Uncharacterized protein n=1 Tax=Lottia gigantea TaxID=225164 RepID=V3ZKF2_LOTGI|nr:hypothetical protein LOTGIDRAFT_155886 [Lottia gigantea]ESO82850.1 hypothetical protein LOTGIDRAFT_155886 [Lottia gigantea]